MIVNKDELDLCKNYTDFLVRKGQIRIWIRYNYSVSKFDPAKKFRIDKVKLNQVFNEVKLT